MECRSAILPLGGALLLFALSRWTILHPITAIPERKDEYRHLDSVYASLHLHILEGLSDIKDLKDKQPVPSKRLVIFLEQVGTKLSDKNLEVEKREMALDRLGQIMHCLTAVKGISGSLSEVCSSLKKLPGAGNNRILTMFFCQFK